MKTVFLVNDDGYLSKGLNTLRKTLLKSGFKVVTVAPDRNMSGSSHSLTFTRPLKIEKHDKDFYYVVDGTPADCVHLGYYIILKEKKPDLLISGINTGPNLGRDVFYSGTVGAAREGTFFGIPSIALSPSSAKNVDFQTISNLALKIVNKVIEKGLPEGVFFNISFPNIPEDKIKGYRFTRIGRGAYEEKIQKYLSPSKEVYYWIGGEESLNLQCDKDTDYTAVKEGYISITPIGIDLTDYRALDMLKNSDFLDF